MTAFLLWRLMRAIWFFALLMVLSSFLWFKLLVMALAVLWVGRAVFVALKILYKYHITKELTFEMMEEAVRKDQEEADREGF